MPKVTSVRGRTAFGLRLWRARKLAGLTQVQAAAAVGCSQGTLGESETKAESSRYITRFAQVYGVGADWLATGEGPEPDWSRGVSSGPQTAAPRLMAYSADVAEIADIAEQMDQRGRAALLALAHALQLPAPTTDAPAEPGPSPIAAPGRGGRTPGA